MNKMTRRNSAPLLLLLAVGTTALSGCSSIDDMINRQETHTYEDKKSFEADSEISTDWVPDDATEITVRSASREGDEVAVIHLDSTSNLPDSCREAERKSAPLLTIDGAPDVYKPKNNNVHICGEWTVMQSSDGWYGWTPNTEDQNG